MKSTKNNKGITLIALIITIVVLLILAAVAIGSIKDNGILRYAQNVADLWNQAQKNEAGIIATYEDYLKWQSCPGHKYVDGVCLNCGYTKCEKHILDANGKCTNCDYQCSHEYDENGNCNYCTNVCLHNQVVYFGGHGGEEHCNICNYYIGQIPDDCFDNNRDCICDVCGAETHVYAPNNNYICGSCGKIHEHNFSDSIICSICGFECQHEEGFIYYNYVQISSGFHDYWMECKICKFVYAYTDFSEEGEACTDADGDEECDLCGYVFPHEHYYDTGNYCICSCGEQKHDYSYDTCQNCGYTCTHEEAKFGYEQSGSPYNYDCKHTGTGQCPECKLYGSEILGEDVPCTNGGNGYCSVCGNRCYPIT